jgi:hypothetical protein
VTVTRNTHSRVLNRLESQAVEMALRERPFSESDPIIVRLGDEEGTPFIAIGRGIDEIIIHFESNKDKAKVELPKPAEPAVTTPSVPAKPAAAKPAASTKPAPAKPAAEIRRGGGRKR